jgi:hypothetical protein
LLPTLTPIRLVRFDEQDTIRSIAEGPSKSRCIQFQTIFGDCQQANEIRVDATNGWLLSSRLGDEITRNSNFFAFAGLFLPGHIDRWVGNTQLIEIDQTIVPRNDYPPDYFSVPETATGFIYQAFRWAYAENAPEPPLCASSLDVQDIKLFWDYRQRWPSAQSETGRSDQDRPQ